MENEKYYSICLWDYALPDFISGATKYYGTLNEIAAYIDALRKLSQGEDIIGAFQEFMSGNKNAQINIAYSDVPLLQPVEVLFEDNCSGQKIEWTHTNVWDCEYRLRATQYNNKHIWIKDSDGKYLRCIKPTLTNLEYENPFKKGKWDLISSFWGQPAIIDTFQGSQNNDIYKGMLYFTECIYDTLQELEDDYLHFNGNAEYKHFCNDIFADG